MRPKRPTSGIERSYDVGPCCACECEGPTVRNVIMLHVRAPQPGTGWGCLVCHLARDGALAVLCDACLGARPGQFAREPRFACDGYLTESRSRAPIESLREPWRHDEALHEEDERTNH